MSVQKEKNIILADQFELDFKKIIGQERIKGYLKKIIESSYSLKKVVPSLIITGPSGGGKTTLAKAIANEIKGQIEKYTIQFGFKVKKEIDVFKFLAAAPDITANDICYLLNSIQDNQVLCIDEAHSLSDSCQEILFQAIDSGLVPQGGEKKPDRIQMHKISSFTLILCTNYPGKIRKELINRLFHLELDPYSNDELIEIARNQITSQNEGRANVTFS